MGAGPSKEQVYRYKYKQLQHYKKELAAKGVHSVYRKGMLEGEGEKGYFLIAFDRMNASNGECCISPFISIHDDFGTENYDFLRNGNFNRGFNQLVLLFGGNNGPTQ